ncbi:hypothetical protein CONLIGDRAFT_40941 [Coniochaeta ligniaria NRRL 30616]|uniref:Complex III subunit 9 n=1 Tax=Coniochaeta ligniaria NRRL 30616 TaxID=1408157 RepID=A0A1J7J4M2_9PEZI|nr:hypothetical protein CONLIGDRAFT_40941 [Coniochaeta ligniaria NRRL 30616]
MANFGPVYNLFFRKNYTMLGVVFAGAFAWEMAFDTTMNNVWDKINKGVCEPHSMSIAKERRNMLTRVTAAMEGHPGPVRRERGGGISKFQKPWMGLRQHGSSGESLGFLKCTN